MLRLDYYLFFRLILNNSCFVYHDIVCLNWFWSFAFGHSPTPWSEWLWMIEVTWLLTRTLHYGWATATYLSLSYLLLLLLLFPLCVAKCIIQLERVKGTERRWKRDSEWVGESLNFQKRERCTLCQSICDKHTHMDTN